MAHKSYYLLTLIALFSILCHFGMCLAEDHDCSLHVAAKAPKYLDCPLVDIADEFFSGEASGLKIVNVSWHIEYCNHLIFGLPCSVFHIDYHGIYININYHSFKLLQNFEVTSSGQLYIYSVDIDMRWTTFNCSVWNESTSQWSQSHTIGPLIILDYDVLYSTENDRIPKLDTFQEPLLIEEAAIGANKVLCMQGEVLEAQVEWTRLEPDHQQLNQVNSSSHFNVLTSRCFECACMVDLIASNKNLQLLNSISESAKFISLTATGYYLPQTFDAFITALECIGIPNWFLSVLLIRNVSESDVGSYGVTVRSTRSLFLNHTRNFTLMTGYFQITPNFCHTMVNRRTTEFIAEGNTTYYICNATIPVSSFLVWKREDNKTVLAMKLITPLNSIAHGVNELCQAYTFSEAISVTIKNSTLYTLEGLVSQQTIALVICNMKSSMVDVYQCIAQSSMGEATSGPQISIDIVPSASSPSHNNNNMLVPYLIMGCVLIVILLLVAILVIVIAHFWLRHQSKQLKSSGTVMHRKREENIYFDARPRMTKEH